jgi:ATP diphosphatase
MSANLQRLLEIMAQLRDPEQGCPWDLKQDFHTIVPYTIEETYEVAEAIEERQFDELESELGDLLFQVVFYAQLGRERNLFDFDSIAGAICEKMLRRHPHVFGDKNFSSEAELKQHWEQSKLEERREKNSAIAPTSQLEGISKTLPSVVRAQKLQKKAARVNFDWDDYQGALEKLKEEIAELETAALHQDNHPAIFEELGDVMFSVVNVARKLSVDAESALRATNRKFENRFRWLEQAVSEQGLQLEQLSIEELEKFWLQAKIREKQDV